MIDHDKVFVQAIPTVHEAVSSATEAGLRVHVSYFYRRIESALKQRSTFVNMVEYYLCLEYVQIIIYSY